MPVKRHFQLLALVVAVVVSYGTVQYISRPGGQNQPQATRLAEIYFYDKLGQKTTLSAFESKVVLVNLWATWCPPCLAEMPALDRLQEKLPAERFKVVAISLDKSFPAKKMKNVQIYWDKDRQVPLKWKYEGLPTSFLLDPDGMIIKQYDGPYEWEKKEMLDEIRNFLPQ